MQREKYLQDANQNEGGRHICRRFYVGPGEGASREENAKRFQAREP